MQINLLGDSLSPNGTGKNIRVLVLTKDDEQEKNLLMQELNMLDLMNYLQRLKKVGLILM